MATFGKAPIHQANVQFDLGVSDDKRAFTLSFNNLEVSAQPGKSSPPMAMRAWSLVLPLEGDEEWGQIAFRLTAFVLTNEGTSATIMFSVNGQTTVSDFAANDEQSFIQEIKLTAEKQSECRLCVFLLLGRDSKNPDASGSLNVTAIDGEILSRHNANT